MIDLSIIIVFLLLTLFVGIYKGRNITSMKEFAVGNQEYATPVLVATIFATMVGGGLTVGFAEKTFSVGIIFIVASMGIALNKVIVAYVFAPRIELFKGSISLGDVLERFYGNWGKIVSGLAAVVFLIGTTGAQIIALGYTSEVLLNIPYEWGLAISATLIIVYSAYGGIAAVTATDVIQFGVLIVAIPILCSKGLHYLHGYVPLFESIPETHTTLVKSSKETWKYVALFLFWLIPSMDPQFVQRLLMAKDAKQIRSSMLASAALTAPFIIIVGLIGFIALALYPEISPNLALPQLIVELLPAGIKGLVIAGMFAVIMSSADSTLNAASIAFSHDIVQPALNKPLSDQRELQLARFMTVVIGLLAVTAAIIYRNVVDLIVGISSIWTPVILAPLFLGLAGFRATSASFLKAIGAGLTTYLLWGHFIEPILGFSGLVPGFLVNGLCILILSNKREKLPNLQAKRKKNKKKPSLYAEENLLGNVQKANLWERFVHLIDRLVYAHNPPYFLFAVFTMINFLMPYFMWFDGSTGNFDTFISFRVVACILCISIMMHEFWPPKLRRYLPILWLGTITFCYPFATGYFVLDNGLSFFSVLNISLILFILILTLEWRLFIASLLTGVGAAIGLYLYRYGGFDFVVPEHSIYFAIYAFIFSIAIGATFSRRRAYIEAEKIQSMRAMGGMIAHELRTPIAAMLGGTTALRNQPNASNSDLTEKVYTAMETAGNQALLAIDMFLVRLKEQQKGKLEVQELDAATTIKDIIAPYPFSRGTEDLVKLELGENFTFVGNKILFQHIIYNLMSNALYQIKHERKGSILIKTEVYNRHHVIRFRDTAGGMTTENRPHIFNKFYTSKETGTGLGLPFCRQAMEQMGGNLECDFEPGEFTDFMLVFKKGR